MTVSLPPELLLEVFKTACMDDGATGRALSLVSRYFRALSSESRLQSITLSSAWQLHRFANYLVDLPPNARLVRHLFVSILYERKRKCRLSKTEIHEFWADEGHSSAAFCKVLQCVAPSLRTLHLVSEIPRTSLLAPVSLPRLDSLTIQGPLHNDHLLGNGDRAFPSLRHLTLTSLTDCPTNIFQDISHQAPSLRSLSFVLEHPLRFLPFDLSRALNHKMCGSRQAPMIPNSLNHIHVQHHIDDDDQNIWTKAARKVMLKNLSKVAETDERVTVVGLDCLHTYHEAKAHWLQDWGSRS